MVDARLPELRRAARMIETELNRYPILIHSIKSAAN
jgi:hypothetical protein